MSEYLFVNGLYVTAEDVTGLREEIRRLEAEYCRLTAEVERLQAELEHAYNDGYDAAESHAAFGLLPGD